MKDDQNNDIEVIRKEWEAVIAYEKSWIKTHNCASIPFQKIIEYFGIQPICKLYGCTVATEMIARELIMEAFA